MSEPDRIEYGVIRRRDSKLIGGLLPTRWQAALVRQGMPRPNRYYVGSREVYVAPWKED